MSKTASLRRVSIRSQHIRADIINNVSKRHEIPRTFAHADLFAIFENADDGIDHGLVVALESVAAATAAVKRLM